MSQSYSGDESIIAQENKLLRERLEKAGADTRRLDWMENDRALLSWGFGTEDVEVIQWGVRRVGIVYRGESMIGDRVRTKGANLREAIDSAIAAQAKP